MITAFLLAASLAQAAPVAPHYVSQRTTQAYLREGPGYAYRVLWVYRHKGTPFRESANYDIWRRVTAPDGAVGWMSMEMLSDSRTVLVTGKGRTQIRKEASPDAKMVGQADPGAVLKLKACAEQACRVTSGDVDGWILKSRIWGVDANEVFK
jgi:SH3-like domain-containing protein